MTRLPALTFSAVLLAVAGAASESGNNNDNNIHRLRSVADVASAPSSRPRQAAVRRLYGPENGQVRKHVRLLEEKSTRSQTGLMGDPSHEVPYENHPYERRGRRRKLQTEDDGGNATTAEYDDGDVVGAAADSFRPLRIRFETQALDDTRSADNAAKIDFIKTEVLTKTAEFWSQALSVVPVSGNLRVSAAELENREYCGDSEFAKVPTDHISTGVADTDLILYVSGTPSSRFCRDTTLAVAVACNFDQFDRPTAGAINVCLDRFTLNDDGTASKAILEDNLDVMIHEVAHVLGHSSNSYRFFWDPATGLERTARPFQTTTITCVDDVERSLVLPDENTMKFSQSANGQRYASIVTEKVRAIARNQFNCQTLEGAKLENQPTGSESCTGDHWDEHDYYPEALSGVISPTSNIMSHLTLALFEDSGWYRANYTQGRMNPWGLNAGCDFVNEPCLVAGADGAPPSVPPYAEGYFCTDASARGCSPALTHKLACSVIDYFYIQPQTLPEGRFQYFPDEVTMGGPRQADYCPLFGSTYGGLDAEQLACTDIKNADSLNIYSEVYGSDSKCIPTDSGEGRCYRTACVKDEMVLRINVRGEWLACEYDFQQLDVRVGAGALPQTMVCPRLSTACPDLFCPFQCAGRGVCNYDVTVNGTLRPTCECFDPNDTSPGCSDSLLPNGGFFDDADDLFDNIEEDFFDPLVAVFVDHPDKWTASSWAWAAGLLAIFLVMLLCICSAFWPESEKSKAFANGHRGAAFANGHRGAAAATSPKDSASKGSSPRKGSPTRRIGSSPNVRSSSFQHRPSSRASSGDRRPSLRISTGQHPLASSSPSSSGQRPSSSHRRSPTDRESPFSRAPATAISPSMAAPAGYEHRRSSSSRRATSPAAGRDHNFGRYSSLSPTSDDPPAAARGQGAVPPDPPPASSSASSSSRAMAFV